MIALGSHLWKYKASKLGACSMMWRILAGGSVGPSPYVLLTHSPQEVLAQHRFAAGKASQLLRTSEVGSFPYLLMACE